MYNRARATNGTIALLLCGITKTPTTKTPRHTVIVLNQLVPRLVRDVLERSDLPKPPKHLLQLSSADAVVGQDGKYGRLHGRGVGVRRKFNVHRAAVKGAAVKLAHCKARGTDVVVGYDHKAVLLVHGKERLDFPDPL